MIAAVAALVQVDPDIVQQLERMVTRQTVIAFALALMSLAALGVAVGALLAIRKLIGTLNQTMAHLTPKLDPILASAERIARDAEDMSSTARVRVKDVMETVDDLNERVRSGADAVELRLKEFGAVVDVVRGETEELLLDAASTARGVHTAAEMLRAGGRPPAVRIRTADYEPDEDELSDEEYDG